MAQSLLAFALVFLQVTVNHLHEVHQVALGPSANFLVLSVEPHLHEELVILVVQFENHVAAVRVFRNAVLLNVIQELANALDVSQIEVV